jgi:LPPG:FO 2-phospho-L-lactate transferase
MMAVRRSTGLDVSPRRKRLVVALSGGIGGAKLALGLSHILDPQNLVVVANTGDDFEHLGLSISPDLDTLMYTLAALNNAEMGWGRRDETWSFMDALERIGGETWFRLGDTDLATSVERTRRLKMGDTLAQITDDFCRSLGVSHRILPMTNDLVRTQVRTRLGWLDFQDYFVRQKCAPAVEAFAFRNVEKAIALPEFIANLSDSELRAVIICPSNPFISIDPILALPGIVDALRKCAAPIIAVSPIIAGQSVKGPTMKMMRELNLAVTPMSVAEHYKSFLNGYIVDTVDVDGLAPPGVEVRSAKILMQTLEDRVGLARECLKFADTFLRTGGQIC